MKQLKQKLSLILITMLETKSFWMHFNCDVKNVINTIIIIIIILNHIYMVVGFQSPCISRVVLNHVEDSLLINLSMIKKVSLPSFSRSCHKNEELVELLRQLC